MKITRDNYEIWFLDYLEGRLDEMNREELRLFLVSHPDLADELEAFPPAITADNKLVFPDRELLKKEQYDDPDYLETAIVAAMEGDLNAEELNDLEKWMTENRESRRLMSDLERIRLQPDTRITFPIKDKLKKKATVMTIWMRIAAVAAILSIAFFMFYPEKTEPGTEVQKAAAIIPPYFKTDEKSFADSKSILSTKTKERPKQIQTAAIYPLKPSKQRNSTQTSQETRQTERIEAMKSKFCAVNSSEHSFFDLVPFNSPELTSLANAEIPLSDFLNNKLHELKANGPKGFITREEVALAGLHLFSRLPGSHLTGRKGSNGRLTSISLNTQLLAFSIPVNR